MPIPTHQPTWLNAPPLPGLTACARRTTTSLPLYSSTFPTRTWLPALGVAKMMVVVVVAQHKKIQTKTVDQSTLWGEGPIEARTIDHREVPRQRQPREGRTAGTAAAAAAGATEEEAATAGYSIGSRCRCCC